MAISAQVLSSQTIKKTKPSAEKTVSFVGRVLAWRFSLVIGAGLGPQYEGFVFAAEAGVSIRPTKIYYAIFQSDGLLPDSFFDYSKRYELQVVRHTRCDESVESFAGCLKYAGHSMFTAHG